MTRLVGEEVAPVLTGGGSLFSGIEPATDGLKG